MSDVRILLCGTALNRAQSLESLERLRAIELPNVTKYVIAAGKFDTGNSAITFNVEAGYPAAPPHLRTLAAWAERIDPSEPRFRDAYDLYCLRCILAKNGPFEYAVLLRGGCRLQEQWPALQKRVAGRLFEVFADDDLASPTSAPDVLFDLKDLRSPFFLDFAWELFASGAAYGVAPYTLQTALDAAADAVRRQKAIGSAEPSRT